MKIIFFGSDDFALKNLEALIESDVKVLACVTQPDKQKGRGLKLTSTPIKLYAVKNKIPIFEPDDLKDKDFINQLRFLEADLFIVIAYGKILPKEVLEIPKMFAINVHASLLPKYRGAAPINWAIINGDKLTGNTIIKINEMMDAGEIIAQQKIPILEQDTALSLRKKMTEASAKFLLTTLDALKNGKYTLTKQDLSQVSYVSKLTKELGLIDWKLKASEIHNLVRGLMPWPTAFTYFKSKRLKLLETEVINGDINSQKPGEVIDINKEGFVVATSFKALLVKKVHLESSKPMEAKSFISGQRVTKGFILG